MSIEREPEDIKRRGRKLTHLNEWLRIRHITQSELARKTGLARMTINKMIVGTNYARAGSVDKIAAALDLPVGILLRDPNDLSMDDLMRYHPVLYRQIMTHINRTQSFFTSLNSDVLGVHEKRHTTPAKGHAGEITPIQQGIRLA